MTTAVASPPSFQSRLGWNASSPGSGNFVSMSADDVSRILMPPKKAMQRTNSSSSLASTSSSASSASTSTTVTTSTTPSGDITSQSTKKKLRGGFWNGKSDSTAVANGRPNGATPGSSINQTLPALPSQTATTQLNGARPLTSPGPMEQTAVLALLPMNGTFERKQISVPFFPDVLRVGRQTNAKTVPTSSNGYFDSKVLSRQHAELWAERNGKIWIRDVKSSNGTFVNGQRLSAENQNSDPHELRQHDTLELGIDIVSEDQKTIVHHKVSAKVEFVGLPGNSNNVMDLNFGDLDPSHGGALLPSPMSAPMVQTRGRPLGHTGSLRASPASSVIGSNYSNFAQQRQLNFWGTPLNVEQLVKSLSVEMRAAREQSSDLHHAGTLLGTITTDDGIDEKQSPDSKDGNQQQHQSIAKSRSLRLDSASRFAEPPAPPPQQPLPEKPDNPKSAAGESSTFSFLKRSETAKPPNLNSMSPHSPPNSQILSLVEALSIAKKELDSQGAKVQQLEEMLRQEKIARENAEEKARRLEQHYSAQPVSILDENDEDTDRQKSSSSPTHIGQRRSTITGVTEAVESEDELQQKLDTLVTEMQKMRSDMARFQQRAETAENDASKARLSLSEMIENLRRKNEAVQPTRGDQSNTKEATGALASAEPTEGVVDQRANDSLRTIKQTNGHIRNPSRLPPQLERAVAAVLRDSGGNPDTFAQTAPYVSMLGVVLIGVGLMAYLNSWQKTEK